MRNVELHRKGIAFSVMGALILLVIAVGTITYIGYTMTTKAKQDAGALVDYCQDSTLTIEDYQEDVRRATQIGYINTLRLAQVYEQVIKCTERGYLPQDARTQFTTQSNQIERALFAYIATTPAKDQDPRIEAYYKTYFGDVNEARSTGNKIEELKRKAQDASSRNKPALLVELAKEYERLGLYNDALNTYKYARLTLAGFLNDPPAYAQGSSLEVNYAVFLSTLMNIDQRVVANETLQEELNQSLRRIKQIISSDQSSATTKIEACMGLEYITKKIEPLCNAPLNRQPLAEYPDLPEPDLSALSTP